jgi:hypothetical protein
MLTHKSIRDLAHWRAWPRSRCTSRTNSCRMKESPTTRMSVADSWKCSSTSPRVYWKYLHPLSGSKTWRGMTTVSMGTPGPQHKHSGAGEHVRARQQTADDQRLCCMSCIRSPKGSWCRRHQDHLVALLTRIRPPLPRPRICCAAAIIAARPGPSDLLGKWCTACLQRKVVQVSRVAIRFHC